jgi:segregation and condensation protein A
MLLIRAVKRYYLDMEKSAFKVKLQTFEGPLDLLLNLIEKHKLSITQVSLAKVADDYLEYIGQMEGFPLSESADFILTASTLVLIKSKSLLPALELTDEESGSVEDLERRLRLYQGIRDASKKLQAMYDDRPMFFPRDRQTVPVFSPHSAITASNVLSASYGLISALPKLQKVPQTVIRKVISLEEMILNLSERITKALRMSFKDFCTAGKKEKTHVIVGFLAMLELIKRGAIKAAQEADFRDITIETEAKIDTPKYI